MSGARHRLFVVEDNPGDARLIELALRAEPPGEFAVRTFARIAEAAASAEGMDVALVDLHLPDADGPEGIRRLRALSDAPAIVAMSGSDDPGPIRSAFANGADGFVRKELYSRGALGAALRGAIAGHRACAAWAEGREWRDGLDPAGEAFLALRSGDLDYANPAAVALAPGLTGEARRLAAAIRSGPAVGASVRAGELRGEAGPAEPEVLRWTAWTVPGPGERTLVWLSRPTRTGTVPASPPPRLVLDPATWADLREQAGEDRTFLPQLVRVFREYAAQLIVEARDAQARRDAPALGRLAHTLRSSAAQVGALDLASVATRIERACQAGDGAAAFSAVPELIQEFDRAQAALAAGPPPP